MSGRRLELKQMTSTENVLPVRRDGTRGEEVEGETSLSGSVAPVRLGVVNKLPWSWGLGER